MNYLNIKFIVLIGLTLSVTSHQSQSTETEMQLAKGYELYKNNCMTCHQSRGPVESRMAPPMSAVKMHYTDESNGLFMAESFKRFIQSPNEENSRMSNAIKKFGLMPNLGLSTKQIDAVTHYIDNTDFSHNRRHGKERQKQEMKYEALLQKTQMSDMEKGKSHVLKVKGLLGQNLMGAIKNGGTANAVNFCNEKAISLAEDAVNEGVTVRRVSDKNRNPTNAATGMELSYIQKAGEALEKGDPIQPQLIKNGDSVTAYYPIITNEMCLQCHGVPGKDIDSETMAIIKSLYPGDQATGYGSNELRGIFVVEMKDTSENQEHDDES